MIYDISRPLSPRTPVFPGDTPVSIAQVMRMEAGDSCNVSSITMSLHAGTHIDAPRHYADGAPGADSLDLQVLTGLARVVTFEGSQVISLAEVQAVHTPGTQRLLIHTHASDAGPQPETFDPSFVCFAPDAADWLGAQGVCLVGVDTPSVDVATSFELPAHKAFLKHEVVIIENLYLGDVPDGEYELMALPIKIVNGDAAPARVILVAK